MAESAGERCPLCGTTETRVCERLSVADIDRLYRKFYGAGVAAAFGTECTIRECRCPTCTLRFYTPACEAPPALYDVWQRQPDYYEPRKPEYDHAAARVARGARLLEVGCGTGAFAAYVGHAVYRGLDTNALAVAAARAKGLDVRLETVEEHARTHAGSYDVVALFQVLEHVRDPAGLLAGCRGCLKPGGRLLVAVPNMDSFYARLMNAPLELPPHHLTRWGEAALRAAGDILGLRVEAVFHEPLRDDRIVACLRTELLWRAYAAIGRRPRSIDFSLTKKVLTLAAMAGAALLKARCRRREPRPRGHRIVISYGKA